MALPTGIEMGAIILLSFSLFVVTVALFWKVIQMGERDGDENWRTPPIDTNHSDSEQERR